MLQFPKDSHLKNKSVDQGAGQCTSPEQQSNFNQWLKFTNISASFTSLEHSKGNKRFLSPPSSIDLTSKKCIDKALLNEPKIHKSFSISSCTRNLNICNKSSKDWIEIQKWLDDNKNSKTKYREIENNTKELKECTFSPTINRKINGTPIYRTADEFYFDQIKYSEQAKEKIKKISNTIITNSLSTFQPAISKNSKKIARLSKKDSKSYFALPVHERLSCNESFIKEQSISKKEYNLVSKFSYMPNVNKSVSLSSRIGPIHNYLYKDALRRVQETKSKEKMIEKESKDVCNKSFVLSKSNIFLCKKFNNEYKEAFERVSKGKKLINYVQTVSLLTMLGFIDLQSKKPKIKDKFLIYDIWNLLRGEDLGGISSRNLNVLLLAIMGFFSSWMSTTNKKMDKSTQYIIIEEENEGNHEEVGVNQLGKIDEITNNFKISKDEAMKIHLYFLQFYYNKMNYEKSLREINTSVLINNQKETFRPKINEKSRQIGLNLINKTLNNANVEELNTKTHIQFLLKKKSDYENKIHKLRKIKEENILLSNRSKPEPKFNKNIKCKKNIND